MRAGRFTVLAACLSLLVGCAGPGADAPQDASTAEFCEAKEWMAVEGANRLFTEGMPSDAELADLIHEWSRELARVGTPTNMSDDARAGFEALVHRTADIDEGDVEDGSFNWSDGSWEGEDEEAFSNYVANTC